MSYNHELYQDLSKGKFFFSFYRMVLANKHFKGLNPGRAIAEIKKLLSGIAKKEEPGLNTAALHNN